MAAQRSKQKAETRIACSSQWHSTQTGRKNAFSRAKSCFEWRASSEQSPLNNFDDEDVSLVSSKSTSCLRMDARWAGQKKAIPVLKANTTLGWIPEVGSVAQTDEHMSFATKLPLITKVSTRKWLKAGEFQIFKGSRKCADDVWIARYLLERLCEKYGIYVEFHCKPFTGDWNGSACTAISPPSS